MASRARSPFVKSFIAFDVVFPTPFLCPFSNVKPNPVCFQLHLPCFDRPGLVPNSAVLVRFPSEIFLVPATFDELSVNVTFPPVPLRIF